MPAKKKTTRRKATKRSAPKRKTAKSASKDFRMTPSHWNSVFVVVSAILLIGIFAGVANLIRMQETKTIVVSASQQDVFTATHTSQEVEDLAALAMSRMGFAGEIDSSVFDTTRGEWSVDFAALSRSGTLTVRIMIDDVDMTVGEVAILVPVPEIKPVALTPGNDPVLGPENAKVTMYIFTDFECDFCSDAAETVSQLMEKYDGQVKFVFKNFPLSSINPNARKAAEAAECAFDQGKFWEYHDMLFEHQDSLEPSSLRAYATELGLDAEQFEACLDSGSKAQEVESDYKEGLSEGISSTPSFFVNQQVMSGALEMATFEKIIDAELAK